jgi:hypothetical protein
MPGSDIGLDFDAETLVNAVPTATVPTCVSEGSSCGSCGAGVCSPDESGSYDVCANSGTCYEHSLLAGFGLRSWERVHEPRALHLLSTV